MFDVYGGESDNLIVTYGRVFGEACEALGLLKKSGIDASILKLNRIRPIPQEAVIIAGKAKRVFFFEEGVKTGGIGEKLAAQLLENGFKGDYSITAVNDKFVKQATISELYDEYGFSAEKIAAKVSDYINKGE